MIVPILLSLYFSFFDWNGISRTMNFTGLRNFVRAVTDQTFLNALRITFLPTSAFTIPGEPGTTWSNGHSSGRAAQPSRRDLQSLPCRLFLSLLISAVAIGFIWKAMLSYNGIFNDAFAAVGMEPIDWLGDVRLAPWTVILINLWHDTGFVTVIYLAGLQAIPRDLYDAATIDGASARQQFAKVTFQPMQTDAQTMGWSCPATPHADRGYPDRWQGP